jgi:hypothetical protein
MKPCRNCGSTNISPSRIKKYDWICNPCRKFNADGVKRVRVKKRDRVIEPDHPGGKQFTVEEIAEMIGLYEAGATLKHLAPKFGCSVESLRRRLLIEDVHIRNQRETILFTRKLAGKPSGSIRDGYRMLTLYEGDRFYAEVKAGSARTRILEHRYAMANHMGRMLEKWELVHHINHDKLDNRIENLELISRAIEHVGETFAHREFIKMKKRISYLERCARLGVVPDNI